MLQDFGRPGIVVSQAARAVAPPKVSTATFTGDGHEPSLTEDDLADLTKEKPSVRWHIQSAASLAGAGLQWACASACGGGWPRMSKAWLSLLAHPGLLLIQKGTNQTKLVLKVSAFGLVLLRTPIAPNKSVSVAAIGAKALSFEVIDDPSPYRVAEVDLVSPGEFEQATSGGMVATLKPRSATTLLKFAAKKGFRNFGSQQLKRLAMELGVIGVKQSSSEAAVLEAVVKHVLQEEATPEAMEAAAVSRQIQGHEPVGLSASQVLTDDVEKFLDEEFAEEDDGSDLLQQWADLKRQTWEKSVAVQKVREKLAGALRTQVGAPKAPAVAQRRRVFVAVRTSGYTAAEAREWLPPGASLSKDDKRENRWRIRASYLSNLGLGQERSKSYGKSSGYSDYGAMKVCLEMAWRSYVLAHGGECPFEWGADDAE